MAEQGKKLSVEEVRDFVKRGETPPDVQKVDDQPSDPSAPLDIDLNKASPAKPWEKKPADSAPRWLPIFTVDSFSAEPFAGNPAAVCLCPSALPEAQMQRVAAEMCLSETAFVVPLPDDSGGAALSFPHGSVFGLRWFTPTTEVPLCGHATLATAHVLFYEMGNGSAELRFRTERAGVLRVQRGGEAGALRMSLPMGAPDALEAPTARPTAWAALLAALDLDGARVRRAAFCAKTRKLLLEVGSVAEIKALRPDAQALLAAEKPLGLDVFGVAVTAADDAPSRGSGLDYQSRYFAPWNGIPEDPVTGSLHTALAVFWRERFGDRQRARQCSARGGELLVLLEEAEGRVIIEGRATTVLGGKIRIQ